MITAVEMIVGSLDPVQHDFFAKLDTFSSYISTFYKVWKSYMKGVIKGLLMGKDTRMKGVIKKCTTQTIGFEYFLRGSSCGWDTSLYLIRLSALRLRRS